jgi:hypothetical protein
MMGSYRFKCKRFHINMNAFDQPLIFEKQGVQSVCAGGVSWFGLGLAGVETRLSHDYSGNHLDSCSIFTVIMQSFAKDYF